jgi:hypothetical protein
VHRSFGLLGDPRQVAQRDSNAIMPGMTRPFPALALSSLIALTNVGAFTDAQLPSGPSFVGWTTGFPCASRARNVVAASSSA